MEKYHVSVSVYNEIGSFFSMVYTSEKRAKNAIAAYLSNDSRWGWRMFDSRKQKQDVSWEIWDRETGKLLESGKAKLDDRLGLYVTL